MVPLTCIFDLCSIFKMFLKKYQSSAAGPISVKDKPVPFIGEEFRLSVYHQGNFVYLSVGFKDLMVDLSSPRSL